MPAKLGEGDTNTGQHFFAQHSLLQRLRGSNEPVCVCVYVCVCARVCMYTHARTHTHKLTHTALSDTRTQTHTHRHTHTLTHTHTHTHIASSRALLCRSISSFSALSANPCSWFCNCWLIFCAIFFFARGVS